MGSEYCEFIKLLIPLFTLFFLWQLPAPVTRNWEARAKLSKKKTKIQGKKSFPINNFLWFSLFLSPNFMLQLLTHCSWVLSESSILPAAPDGTCVLTLLQSTWQTHFPVNRSLKESTSSPLFMLLCNKFHLGTASILHNYYQLLYIICTCNQGNSL